MTAEVDVSALERSSSAAVELLGLTTLRSSGAAAGVSGFEAFGRVYASVAIAEFRRESRDATVTVTLEQSDDGETWEAAADPFVFTGDGVQFAEIDTPGSYLRISWVFSARLRSCRVTSASVIPGSLDAPSDGGEGGGSQPGVFGSRDFLFTEKIDPGTSFAITAVDTDAGTVTIAGNHAALFPANALFAINGSTGNDGPQQSSGAVFSTGSTVITTVDGLGDATVDGDVIAGVSLAAALDIPAGAVVTDLDIYGQTEWAAEETKLYIGDTANGFNAYCNGVPAPIVAYDPQSPIGDGTDYWTLRLLSTANAADPTVSFASASVTAGTANSAAVHSTRPGIPYADDDVLAMVIWATSRTPPSPTGVTRIKVSYFAAITPVNAA